MNLKPHYLLTVTYLDNGKPCHVEYRNAVSNRLVSEMSLVEGRWMSPTPSSEQECYLWNPPTDVTLLAWLRTQRNHEFWRTLLRRIARRMGI